MQKEDKFDNFFQEFMKFVPEDFRQTRSDIEKNVKAAMHSAFARMDLVTREEFDIQAELLSRTRALVDELQTKLDELEKSKN